MRLPAWRAALTLLLAAAAANAVPAPQALQPAISDAMMGAETVAGGAGASQLRRGMGNVAARLRAQLPPPPPHVERPFIVPLALSPSLLPLTAAAAAPVITVTAAGLRQYLNATLACVFHARNASAGVVSASSPAALHAQGGAVHCVLPAAWLAATLKGVGTAIARVAVGIAALPRLPGRSDADTSGAGGALPTDDTYHTLPLLIATGAGSTASGAARTAVPSRRSLHLASMWPRWLRRTRETVAVLRAVGLWPAGNGNLTCAVGVAASGGARPLMLLHEAPAMASPGYARLPANESSSSSSEEESAGEDAALADVAVLLEMREEGGSGGGAAAAAAGGPSRVDLRAVQAAAARQRLARARHLRALTAAAGGAVATAAAAESGGAVLLELGESHEPEVHAGTGDEAGSAAWAALLEAGGDAASPLQSLTASVASPSLWDGAAYDGTDAASVATAPSSLLQAGTAITCRLPSLLTLVAAWQRLADNGTAPGASTPFPEPALRVWLRQYAGDDKPGAAAAGGVVAGESSALPLRYDIMLRGSHFANEWTAPPSMRGSEHQARGVAVGASALVPVPMRPAFWHRIVTELNGDVDTQSADAAAALRGVWCRFGDAIVVPAVASPSIPGFLCPVPDAAAMRLAVGVADAPDLRLLLAPSLPRGGGLATSASASPRFSAPQTITLPAIVAGDELVDTETTGQALHQLYLSMAPLAVDAAGLPSPGARLAAQLEDALTAQLHVTDLGMDGGDGDGAARLSRFRQLPTDAHPAGDARPVPLPYPLRIVGEPVVAAPAGAATVAGGAAPVPAAAHRTDTEPPPPQPAQPPAANEERTAPRPGDGVLGGPPPLHSSNVTLPNDLVASHDHAGAASQSIAPNPPYLATPAAFDAVMDRVAHDVMGTASLALASGAVLAEPERGGDGFAELVAAYVAAYRLARVPAGGANGGVTQALVARICDALNVYVLETCPAAGITTPLYRWGEAAAAATSSATAAGAVRRPLVSMQVLRHGCTTVGALLRAHLPQCVLPPPEAPPPPPPAAAILPDDLAGTIGYAPLPVRVDISVDDMASWLTVVERFTYWHMGHLNLSALAHAADADAAAATPAAASAAGMTSPGSAGLSELMVEPAVVPAGGGGEILIGPLPIHIATGLARLPAPPSPAHQLHCGFALNASANGILYRPAAVDAGNLWRLLINDAATMGWPVVSLGLGQRPPGNYTTVRHRAAMLAAAGITLSPPTLRCTTPALRELRQVAATAAGIALVDLQSQVAVVTLAWLATPTAAAAAVPIPVAWAWQAGGAVTYVAAPVVADVAASVATRGADLALTVSQDATAPSPPWAPMYVAFGSRETGSVAAFAHLAHARVTAHLGADGRTASLLLGTVPASAALGSHTIAVSADGVSFARRADTTRASNDGAAAPPRDLPRRDAIIIAPHLHLAGLSHAVINASSSAAAPLGTASLPGADTLAASVYTVAAITPSLGSADGGTIVTVRARGVGGGNGYLCRFGLAVVPAYPLPWPLYRRSDTHEADASQALAAAANASAALAAMLRDRVWAAAGSDAALAAAHLPVGGHAAAVPAATLHANDEQLAQLVADAASQPRWASSSMGGARIGAGPAVLACVSPPLAVTQYTDGAVAARGGGRIVTVPFAVSLNGGASWSGAAVAGAALAADGLMGAEVDAADRSAVIAHVFGYYQTADAVGAGAPAAAPDGLPAAAAAGRLQWAFFSAGGTLAVPTPGGAARLARLDAAGGQLLHFPFVFAAPAAANTRAVPAVQLGRAAAIVAPSRVEVYRYRHPQVEPRCRFGGPYGVVVVGTLRGGADAHTLSPSRVRTKGEAASDSLHPPSTASVSCMSPPWRVLRTALEAQSGSAIDAAARTITPAAPATHLRAAFLPPPLPPTSSSSSPSPPLGAASSLLGVSVEVSLNGGSTWHPAAGAFEYDGGGADGMQVQAPMARLTSSSHNVAGVVVQAAMAVPLDGAAGDAAAPVIAVAPTSGALDGGTMVGLSRVVTAQRAAGCSVAVSCSVWCRLTVGEGGATPGASAHRVVWVRARRLSDDLSMLGGMAQCITPPASAVFAPSVAARRAEEVPVNEEAAAAAAARQRQWARNSGAAASSAASWMGYDVGRRALLLDTEAALNEPLAWQRALASADDAPDAMPMPPPRVPGIVRLQVGIVVGADTPLAAGGSWHVAHDGAFTFARPLAVLAVSPLMVHAQGGSTVFVAVANASGDAHTPYYVRFGNVVVRGMLADASLWMSGGRAAPALSATVVVIAPPLAPGSYRVAVSGDDGQHYAAFGGGHIIAVPPTRLLTQLLPARRLPVPAPASLLLRYLAPAARLHTLPQDEEGGGAPVERMQPWNATRVIAFVEVPALPTLGAASPVLAGLPYPSRLVPVRMRRCDDAPAAGLANGSVDTAAYEALPFDTRSVVAWCAVVLDAAAVLTRLLPASAAAARSMARGDAAPQGVDAGEEAATPLLLVPHVAVYGGSGAGTAAAPHLQRLLDDHDGVGWAVALHLPPNVTLATLATGVRGVALSLHGDEGAAIAPVTANDTSSVGLTAYGPRDEVAGLRPSSLSLSDLTLERAALAIAHGAVAAWRRDAARHAAAAAPSAEAAAATAGVSGLPALAPQARAAALDRINAVIRRAAVAGSASTGGEKPVVAAPPTPAAAAATRGNATAAAAPQRNGSEAAPAAPLASEALPAAALPAAEMAKALGDVAGLGASIGAVADEARGDVVAPTDPAALSIVNALASGSNPTDLLAGVVADAEARERASPAAPTTLLEAAAGAPGIDHEQHLRRWYAPVSLLIFASPGAATIVQPGIYLPRHAAIVPLVPQAALAQMGGMTGAAMPVMRTVALMWQPWCLGRLALTANTTRAQLAPAAALPHIIIDGRLAREPAVGPPSPAGIDDAGRGRNPRVFAMRLVPQVMARSPVAFPATIAAMAAFERLLVSDLLAATGTAPSAASLSLGASHLPSGVLIVRCVALGTNGDVCWQLLLTLRSIAPNSASILYMGAVTWANDPRFPIGELPLWPGSGGDGGGDGGGGGSVGGGGNGGGMPFPHVAGACSDPTRLTRADCTALGSCSCTGVPPNDAAACAATLSASGTACTFTPVNRWDPFGTPQPLDFGECSEPGHISEDDCLNDGECSDARYSNARLHCLAQGRCRQPDDMLAMIAEGARVVSIRFGQFTTKVTCEQPPQRPPKRVGRCIAPAGGPADYPFSRFKDRVKCEEPGERAVPKELRGVNRGYACVHPTTRRQTDPDTGYDFSVHDNQRQCEQPETRTSRARTPPAAAAAGAVSLAETGHRSRGLRRGEQMAAARQQVVQPATPPRVAADDDHGPVGLWLDVMGPAGRWLEDEADGGAMASGDAEELALQYEYLPGVWEPHNKFKPKNTWKRPRSGAAAADPCPCNWQSNRYHLSKCNWWRCGPSARGIDADGYVRIARSKNAVEMVSDYQSFVNVGGRTLWMNLDTGTSTSWAMSMACFFEGCLETPLFAGLFIPMIPPRVTVIDLFERGLMQIGSMIGFLGHTFVSVAGKFSLGAPLAMGFLDIGNIGEYSYNHTGALGFAFWEDNWAWWLVPRDPMLSILDFMRCGSIFFPIPAVPLPIPKPFQLWPLPPFFPTGYVFRFAFFYSDRGGCFFMNGAPSQFSREGMSSIFIIPLAIRSLAPSWMFFLNDIRVNGRSIRPCLIPPLCRAVIRTGQFSVTGPMYPMLALLEEVAAASTCEGVDDLPDITFVINGRPFTLTRHDYVIFGQNFDDVQCMTAFTPEAQLIPGLEMWAFGDSFVRAFYAIFHELPLRRLELGLADHRYYEKNGCAGGEGQGPLIRWKADDGDDGGKKPPPRKPAVEAARAAKSSAGMHWKRRQNWEADLAGQAAAAAVRRRNNIVGPPFGKCRRSKAGSNGQRFATDDAECEEEEEPGGGGGDGDRSEPHPEGAPQSAVPRRTAGGFVTITDTYSDLPLHLQRAGGMGGAAGSDAGAPSHVQSASEKFGLNDAMREQPEVDAAAAAAAPMVMLEVVDKVGGADTGSHAQPTRQLLSLMLGEAEAKAVVATDAEVHAGHPLSELAVGLAADGTLLQVTEEAQRFREGATGARSSPRNRGAGERGMQAASPQQLRSHPLVAATLLETSSKVAAWNQLSQEHLVATAQREKARGHGGAHAATGTREHATSGVSLGDLYGASRGAGAAAVSQAAHLHGLPPAHLAALRAHPDPLVAYAAAVAPLLPELASRVDETDAVQAASFHANLSTLMAHAAVAMNISDVRLARYWRGESVEWMEAELARSQRQYALQLRRAQRELADHDEVMRDTLRRLRELVGSVRFSDVEKEEVFDASLVRLGLVGDADAAAGAGAPADASMERWLDRMSDGRGVYPFTRFRSGVGDTAAAATPTSTPSPVASPLATGGGPWDDIVIDLAGVADGDAEPRLRQRGGGGGHFATYADGVLSLLEEAHDTHQSLARTGIAAAGTGLPERGGGSVVTAGEMSHAAEEALAAHSGLMQLQEEVQRRVRELREARRGGLRGV